MIACGSGVVVLPAIGGTLTGMTSAVPAEIRVRRLPAVGGMMRRWRVEVDGEKRGVLRIRDHVAIPVEAGDHLVRVAGRPKEGFALHVSEGTFVELGAVG